MKEKEKRDVGPFELADYLENMAQNFRSGFYEVQGKKFVIPQKLEFKISVKEKKGFLSQKLVLGWSTLESYAPEDKKAVIRWKDSFKNIKKRLSFSMKDLIKTAENGDIPDSETLSRFVMDSQKFAEFAEPEWETEMEEFMDHLANLQAAVEEGRLEAVRHELRDLKNRTKACHKEYK